MLQQVELEDLVRQLMPILQRQLTTSINQIDDNASALTLRFSSLVTELEQVENLALINDRALLDDAVERDQGSLRTLHKEFNSIKHSGQSLISRISELNNHSSQLDAMASSVSQLTEQTDQAVQQAQINAEEEGFGQNSARVADEALQVSKLAEQTNQLALEAALEAVRSGSLSDNLGEAGCSPCLSTQITRLNGEFKQMLGFLEQSNHTMSHSINTGQDVLGTVIEGLRSQGDKLTRDRTRLMEMNQQIKQEVDHMLIAFQSQDRVVQILNQILNSLALVSDVVEQRQLERAAGKQPGPLNIDDILSLVKQNYTTTEQYQDHANDSSETEDHADSGAIMFL